MTWNEADLAAIGKIQERRNCTIDNAKRVYRMHVNKLANPDVENRAELVLASIDRGVEMASDEEAEAAVSENKRPTRNQRRLAKKEKEKVKAKVKKAIKAASRKKTGAAKKSAPRVECELVPPTREVELVPTEVNHVYTASLFGRKYACLWAELDHAEQGAKSRFGPVDISQRRLDAVKVYGEENNLPVAVCVTVRVGGRLDQGYAVPLSLYDEFKSGKRNSLVLSGEARKAYGEEGWDGCKFSEKAAETKAA